jgi:hypothetical protein
MKARIWRALDREIRVSGLPCEVAQDGMTVEIDDGTDSEPNALMNCGNPIPDEATAATNPVVIMEMLLPLMVRPLRREIAQHCRTGGRIETNIIRGD